MNDPYQILGVSENAPTRRSKKHIGTWPGSTTRITTTTIRWRIWRRRR